MKILFDVDVLLDVALEREGFKERATPLLRRVELGAAEGAMAWHSASIVHYLLKRVDGSRVARQFLSDLTAYLEIAPTGTADFRRAASFPMPDFEDAMQAAAALACGADFIATRNLKDYRNSPVPAAEPATIVALLAS